MRRILFSFGFVFLFLLQTPALAQSGRIILPLDPMVPVITGVTDIAVGRTLVLDASSSLGVDKETDYRWYVDGVSQPISTTLEAVYTPEQAGELRFRLVLSREINGETVEVDAEHTVTVYERKVVMVVDRSIPAEKIVNHQRRAQEQDVLLRVITPKEAAIPIGDEEALISVIRENGDAFVGAQAIILWTDGITGLQALLRAFEGDETRLQAIRTQTILMITESGLGTLARSVRGPFSVLRPERIVLTRKEAIAPLLSTDTPEDFLTVIDQWDIDYEEVNKSSIALRPWNLLSSLVNYMLTHGVPSKTVIMLLILPVIATILAFLKQVIGVTTFGLYTPSVIALSFLALGPITGTAFLIFIVLTGYLTRSVMKRYRLLYIPKVAIILTVVSLTLLLLLGLGAFFGLTLSGDTIFILLIMSTLSESFLNIKTEQGWYSAVLGIGETIFAALLCVFIVEWSVLQSYIVAYPELILFTLPINIFLGRWTGLRIVEYFRFKEVFKHLQEE